MTNYMIVITINNSSNSNNNDFKSSLPTSPLPPLVSTGITSNQLEPNIDKSLALKDEIENAKNDEDATTTTMNKIIIKIMKIIL